MITDFNYFSNELTQINNDLFDEKLEFEIFKLPLTNFKTDYISKRYTEFIKSFPHRIVASSKKAKISSYILNLDYAEKEMDTDKKMLSPEIIQEIIKYDQELTFNDAEKCSLYDIIVDFVISLVNEYNTYLSNAKDLQCFTGIDNEEIILKNLLVLYRSVIQDENSQLVFFDHIIFPKVISDQLTQILIDIIENRLLILNPEINISHNNKVYHATHKSSKLEWLGTQHNFIELINELIDKKWINDIPSRGRKEFIDSILDVFDLTQTRRKKGSNLNNSTYQSFKGYLDGNKRKYNFLEKDDYIRRFDQIKKR